jgi:uncharacterized membrane protein
MKTDVKKIAFVAGVALAAVAVACRVGNFKTMLLND